MIDITKVIRRAWHILWNYRMLWIFGAILALTAGGTIARGGANARGGERSPIQYQLQQGELEQWFQHDVQPLFNGSIPVLTTILWITGVLAVLMILTGIVMAIARYVSETAVIRGVDDYEQSGTKVGFRQGWAYGWSRTSWRLFLINLLIHLPVLVLIAVLALIGGWIYFSVIGGSEAARVISIIAAVGLAFLFIFLTIILEALLVVIRHFAWRACVIEKTGVIESLKNGFALVKRHWQSVGLMWLVMIGVGIVWWLASILVVIALIPAFIVMALPAVVVTAIPALLTAGITSLFTTYPWPWIIAAVIALPFFVVIAFSPMLLVGGWVKLFESNVWTLTYRELKAMDSVAAGDASPKAD
jgi:hypothetical protein